LLTSALRPWLASSLALALAACDSNSPRPPKPVSATAPSPGEPAAEPDAVMPSAVKTSAPRVSFAHDLLKARECGQKLVATLQAELSAAMSQGGPAAAIATCKTRAPAIAKEIGEAAGVEIHRVSPKNRNPRARLDETEQKFFKLLSDRRAAGEAAESLETFELSPTELRYAKALVTQPLCLSCHGPVEALDPKVKEALARDYPEDLATGYEAGQIRGLISLRMKRSSPVEASSETPR
jgi:hypothetical protein